MAAGAAALNAGVFRMPSTSRRDVPGRTVVKMATGAVEWTEDAAKTAAAASSAEQAEETLYPAKNGEKNQAAARSRTAGASFTADWLQTHSQTRGSYQRF
jgi:hypothetical protein